MLEIQEPVLTAGDVFNSAFINTFLPFPLV